MSTRWWQWPTVLSLDAPLVSVLWQTALARVAGIHLRSAHIIVLAATVWLAYAADRWIEGWHVHWRDIRTQRHHFYQRWRWPVAAVWLTVFVADVAVAFVRLTLPEILSGALLMAFVLLYLLSHQLVHRHRPRRLPKELCVAALLTGGVCVFLLPSAHLTEIASSASLFALLCFTNCALISTWEREVDLSHGQSSLATDVVVDRSAFVQLPWLVASLSLLAFAAASGPARDVAACALASAVLLAGVDRLEHRAGWKVARVLADVALMTPLVPLLF
ncbi:MAG: hypothetical protein WCQ64_16015 [Acidobacteriota bacterium]